MFNLHIKGVSGRLLLGFALILLTCVGVLGTTLYNLNHIADNFNINYSKKLPAQLNVAALEKMVVDMETGVRGYLLTADEAFLEPYDTVEDDILRIIESTQDLLKNSDPVLVQNLAEIEELLGQWDNEVAGVEIVLMQEGRVDEAHAFVRSGEGKRLFDGMRAKFTNLHALLNAETAGHYRKVADLVTRSNKISMLMIVLLLLLGAGVFYHVSSYLNRRLKAIALQANDVASGSFNEDYKIDDVEDELSPILMSLRDIDKAFHEMTVQASNIGQGDYSSDIALRSSEDEMGMAMQHMVQTLRDVVEVVGQVADGDLRGKVTVKGDHDQLAAAINSMTFNLSGVTDEVNEQLWMQQGVAAVSDAIRDEKDLAKLAEHVITVLANYLGMQFGALYYMMPKGGYKHQVSILKLVASYGYTYRKKTVSSFAVGESLVGQAAFEGKVIVVDDGLDNYVKVRDGSSVDKHRQLLVTPHSVLVIPFLFEGDVKGVIELGSLQPIQSIHIELLESVVDMITVAFNAVDSRMELAEALGEAQGLAKALQNQQDTLQETNEVLERQTLTLEKAHEQAEERNAQLEDAQIKLNKHAKELATSSQYKSEFLANMSHELRTPLNSILLLSKMLAEGRSGEVNQEQSKQAGVIHSAGSDLLQMINEILELSKIEAGKMTISLDDVKVVDFTHQFVDLFAPLAEDKGLSFEVKVDNDAPRLLHTDQDRVQQVLRNFLANAFKFTEHGGVTLRVESVQDVHLQNIVAADDIKEKISENRDGYVVFSVKDTGIGITEQSRLHIFEAFQQEDGSTSRRYGGTGLGLSISKEIAQILSGALALTSETKKGSVFYCILPINMHLVQQQGDVLEASVDAVSNKPSLEKENTISVSLASMYDVQVDAGDDALHHKTVLLVDDDIRNAFALSSVLQSKGLRVLTAGNGQEALDKLTSAVDIVLMDIMMPEMDGYEATRQIRQMPECAGLPIIALTAKALKEDKEQCLAAGATDYLPKPVDGEQLFDMMHKLLQES